MAMVSCKKCCVPVSPENARAVLRDPGKRSDGTGGLFIVMGWVVSMSDFAGPYCSTCALARVNELNAPAVTGEDDRPYPSGQSNDARLQRRLVDEVTNLAIREGGTDEVILTGGDLYALLYDFTEWSYWNGVNDVHRVQVPRVL